MWDYTHNCPIPMQMLACQAVVYFYFLMKVLNAADSMYYEYHIRSTNMDHENIPDFEVFDTI